MRFTSHPSSIGRIQFTSFCVLLLFNSHIISNLLCMCYVLCYELQCKRTANEKLHTKILCVFYGCSTQQLGCEPNPFMGMCDRAHTMMQAASGKQQTAKVQKWRNKTENRIFSNALRRTYVWERTFNVHTHAHRIFHYYYHHHIVVLFAVVQNLCV